MKKNKRKSLSKKQRFTVFERDGFQCSYCGSRPPDVVLVVDHYVPVKEGGTNVTENLFTACLECNQGKGAKIITGPYSPKIEERLAQVEEKYEQMLAFYRHQKNVIDLQEDVVSELATYWSDLWNGRTQLNTRGCASLKNFLKKSTMSEIREAMDISMKLNKPNDAFRYMCGVLHNKRREREQLRDF